MEEPIRIKCSTPRCRNLAGEHRKLCYKCKSRLAKQRHPEYYYFNALRNNARRRGKEFLLTFEEFKLFCDQTGYIEKKGRFANGYSIDRKDATLGYSIDNIQVLTLAENARKEHFDKMKCPF